MSAIDEAIWIADRYSRRYDMMAHRSTRLGFILGRLLLAALTVAILGTLGLAWLALARWLWRAAVVGA